ncbi:MAG: putative secreted protein [Myxococcaceae bacterium]|nr:putative secreted protein [Myxococcaceae bacterium]
MPDGGRAGGLFAVLLLAFLTVPPATSAQLPAQVSIAWRDEASCPRPLRLSLESEVARLLGPSAQKVEPSAFEAHVERLEAGVALPYRLTLEVRSNTHRAERQMDLASCAEAQDAAALLIATAIDPEAVMRTSAEAPPPEPPEVPRPRPPSLVPHRWSLVARGLFDAFALPGATAGPSVGVLLARPRFRVWSEARYLFARRTEQRAASSLQADADLFALAVGTAYVWPFGALVVGPGAELELGALRARGHGGGNQAASLHDASPWGLLDLGGVAGYGVHRRVGLELSMFAGLPLFRPQLAVRGEREFYTTAALTIRVAVGVRISLGSR